MADIVQYRLERMVNELDDLERRGLFTHREIAEIVKQRRKFEYRLKRPSPLKQDYLAYIDYETQLDSLRRLRKKSIEQELKKQGTTKKKKKKSVSDFSAVLRIVDIYRLAVMRYKGDINLWFRYLEFCREKKHGRMKKVLAQAIRLHPKVPGIWIYAAAWEFNHNLNVAAARALMQAGLRTCPNSEDLWVEYLRMELTYLNKLKARKVALGEDEGTMTREPRIADEKQWRNENKDLFMSLTDERENNEHSVKAEDLEKKKDLFREQGLGILRTVYTGAVEALPSSLSLRKRFLEIVEATDLGQTEDMRKEILTGMKRDFSSEPEFWHWLARLECDPGSIQKMSEECWLSQTEKVVQVYEEAIKVLPLPIMFQLYAKFLMGILVPQRGENQTPELSSLHSTYISYLLMVYEKAEAIGCTNEDLACQQISFYLQVGRLDEARKLAEKYCQGKFANSVELCLLRASLEIRHATRDFHNPTKADLQFIFDILKGVLTEAPVSRAENLWLMALKLFANHKDYFDKLVEFSMVSLTRDGGSENGFSISSTIVNIFLQKEGTLRARETYKRFLALPHPGIVIYKNCIELETNLASAGDKDGLVNARKLYESALTTYSQNISLWKDYYLMETKMGTSKTASSVDWRARKILKDTTALVTPDI